MPYLDEARKTFIGLSPEWATKPGDMNWLFTLAIIKVWERCPRYKTIHYLRKACYYEPSTITEICVVEQRLLHSEADGLDIKVARELAFNEFMRRIGNKYEDQKIKKNGDVYPEEK